MNTKLRIKSIAFFTVICLGVTFSAVWTINAYYEDAQPDTMIIVEGDYIEAANPETNVELGSMVSANNVLDWAVHNELQTYMISGDCADATTTLFSFLNPFGSTASTSGQILLEAGEIPQDLMNLEGKNATSTVDMVMIKIDGIATTSLAITCGAVKSLGSSPKGSNPRLTDGHYQIATFYIPTSTKATVHNNMATTTRGFTAAGGTNTAHLLGGGSDTSVLLTNDYSYFTCHATGTCGGATCSDEWGHPDDVLKKSNPKRNTITGDENAFSCTYKVRIIQDMR